MLPRRIAAKLFHVFPSTDIEVQTLYKVQTPLKHSLKVKSSPPLARLQPGPSRLHRLSTDACVCVTESRLVSHLALVYEFGSWAFFTSFVHGCYFPLWATFLAGCLWNSRTVSITTQTRGKKNPTPPVQLKINVTSPPEDRRCVFTGQLCESHSSPSRKVSGGVRLYVGVFSADCTPGMSLCSLQWSQASNLRISSDFFSSTQPSPRCFLSLLLRFLFPPPSFHLLSLRGLKTNLWGDWNAPQILIVSSMLECLQYVWLVCPCKVVI